jgi:uncharacterized protein (DUF1810 family)
MSRLNRFKDAQDQPGSGFEAALREIESGKKQGHWIWYVFPQLAGLGMSSMSQVYAIADAAEAEAYLRDETLRARLLTITRAVATQLRAPRSVPLATLMGSRIDALKLVSSMTLFAHIAETLHARENVAEYTELASLAREILAIADAQGYPACQHTLTKFGRRSP